MKCAPYFNSFSIRIFAILGVGLFMLLEPARAGDPFIETVTVQPSNYGPKIILNDSNTSNKVPLEFRSNNNIKWELGQRPASEDTDMVLWRYKNGSYSRTMTWDYSTGYVGIGSEISNPTALLHTNLPTYGDHIRLERTGASPSYYAVGLLGNKIYHKASVDQVFQEDGVDRMIIKRDGNVGIGTDTPDYKLDVKGTIRAEEIIVATGWADYVFENEYELRSLSEVESHIREHGHLPGIPTAEDVVENGISLGDTQRLLLEKIEELTLYSIDQGKQLTDKDSRVLALELRNEQLENRLAALERLLSE